MKQIVNISFFVRRPYDKLRKLIHKRYAEQNYPKEQPKRSAGNTIALSHLIEERAVSMINRLASALLGVHYARYVDVRGVQRGVVG